MHPMTTSLASGFLASASSRIVSTDSRLASSMNPQVFTITTSAASGDEAST
jgi:hypothetical protein